MLFLFVSCFLSSACMTLYNAFYSCTCKRCLMAGHFMLKITFMTTDATCYIYLYRSFVLYIIYTNIMSG